MQRRFWGGVRALLSERVECSEGRVDGCIYKSSKSSPCTDVFLTVPYFNLGYAITEPSATVLRWAPRYRFVILVYMFGG